MAIARGLCLTRCDAVLIPDVVANQCLWELTWSIEREQNAVNIRGHIFYTNVDTPARHHCP